MVVSGGRRGDGPARSPHVGQRQKGFYVHPTVFTGVKESMRGYKEEIFGSVVVIAIHAAEDEAVDAANNTTYGLSAAVFANDLERAHRIAAEIEAGMVWINSMQDCDPKITFGGGKLSGIWRSWGRLGLRRIRRLRLCMSI
jgi:aldehyde dehydrogenase (NAD+)